MDLQLLASAVIHGKHKEAEVLARQALAAGLAAEAVLKEGLISGMEVIGERFGRNEIFVPEVLLAARALKTALAVLEPALTACGVEPVATIVLGTVKGDLHDIGKNLVGMMFKGNGFKVIDLGTNVSSDKFIKAIEEEGAEFLGMSALLTTTMSYMETVIEKTRSAGFYGRCKALVGGAPVTPRFAAAIGAHGYGKDAAAAVQQAKALLAAPRGEPGAR